MSEIEKLYKNTGIEKIHNCKGCEYEEEYICPDSCPQQQLIYPPFNAEKQLEITKFLFKKAIYYDIENDKYWFCREECESEGYKPFDEAIAHFINKLWQSLTEEEKGQIRGILNG